MGHRGKETRAGRRQLNLRASRAKLEGLLGANFRDGAQLVTLSYSSGPVPPRRLAELQLLGWLRCVRDKQGQRLPYIRATEREKSVGGYPVHRVVLGLSGAPGAVLGELWDYGLVTVEQVQPDGMAALSALLMGQALEAGRVPVPCGRVWSPSAGLIRPEKKGAYTA
ncbi:MAG: hypothetical protein AB7E30_03965 [Lawsonibacter sp.]